MMMNFFRDIRASARSNPTMLGIGLLSLALVFIWSLRRLSLPINSISSSFLSGYPSTDDDLSTRYHPGFATQFIDPLLDNAKGHSTEARYLDIMSDPSNLLVPRVPGAGSVEKIDGEDVVLLHNGYYVMVGGKNGYYGTFGDILMLNHGIHEPAEERLFGYIIDLMEPGSTMVELGSYWAMYSIWFNKRIPEAKNYAVEAGAQNLEIGKRNCELNGATVDFTQGLVTTGKLLLSNFMTEKKIEKINLLHVDIQGDELHMLHDISNHMDTGRIEYLFVSTHSQELHHQCLAFIKQRPFRIIAAADFDNETFSYDGFIVACPESDTRLPFVHTGSRRRTPLRRSSYGSAK